MTRPRFSSHISSAVAALLLGPCLALAVGCGSAGAPTKPDLAATDKAADPNAATPHDPLPRIVLSADTSGTGDDDIYTIDPTLGDLVRITNTTAAERYPAWSRDKKLIAFAKSRDRGQLEDASALSTQSLPQRSDLIVMDSDGNNRRVAFTADAAQGFRAVYSPRFSPVDGRIIATVVKEDGTSTLRVIDGSPGGREISATLGGAGSWSPDGKRYVFAAHAKSDVQWRLYVVPTDGSSAPKAITQPPIVFPTNVPFPTAQGLNSPSYYMDTAPVWVSATMIVFSRVVFGTGPLQGADQSGIHKLDPTDKSDPPVASVLIPGRNFGPAFSPDQTKIAYVQQLLSDPAHPQQLFVGPANGSQPAVPVAQGVSIHSFSW